MAFTQTMRLLFICASAFTGCAGDPSASIDGIRSTTQSIAVQWPSSNGAGVTRLAGGRYRVESDIDQARSLRFIDSSGSTIKNKYTLRFRQTVERFGREQGLEVNDGSYRAQIYFEPDRVRIRQSDGTTKPSSFPLGNGPHDIELIVEPRTSGPPAGVLFIDSQLVQEWDLQARNEDAQIVHWAKGPDRASITVEGTEYVPSKAFLLRSDWTDGTPYTQAWQASGAVSQSSSAGVELTASANNTTQLGRTMQGLNASRVHFRRTIESPSVPGAPLGEHGFALYSGGARTVVYIEREGVRVRSTGYNASNDPDPNHDVALRLLHWSGSEVFQSHDYEVITRVHSVSSTSTDISLGNGCEDRQATEQALSLGPST